MRHAGTAHRIGIVRFRHRERRHRSLAMTAMGPFGLPPATWPFPRSVLYAVQVSESLSEGSAKYLTGVVPVTDLNWRMKCAWS